MNRKVINYIVTGAMTLLVGSIAQTGIRGFDNISYGKGFFEQPNLVSVELEIQKFLIHEEHKKFVHYKDSSINAVAIKDSLYKRNLDLVISNINKNLEEGKRRFIDTIKVIQHDTLYLPVITYDSAYVTGKALYVANSNLFKMKFENLNHNHKMNDYLFIHKDSLFPGVKKSYIKDDKGNIEMELKRTKKE